MIRPSRLLSAALVAPLALLAVGLGVSPAVAATPSALVINEVEQDGSPDWIELYNTSSEPVDAGGLVVRDNKDADDHVVIPAGTVIPGSGFLVLETGADGSGTPGLGKNGDSARLFEADGVTLISGYTWASDPGTSWGRCPDGTGEFGATTAPTPGAANVCPVVEQPEEPQGPEEPTTPDYTGVVINEVNPNGSDWVELMNTGTAAVDVAGLLLKDSGEGNTFTVPAASTIAPGGYLTVDVGGLGGSGDSARLFDGTTLLDSATWTSAVATTWGRCPDGTGAFGLTDAATRSAANACPAPSGWEDVVINEIESSGGDPADWVELYNTGSSPVDLSGWYVKDDNDSRTFRIPNGTTIAGGGYYVAVVDVPGGFGLGNQDEARVFLADGTTLVDETSWGPNHAATTWGRCPNGTGAFAETFASTKGAANDCSFLRINEVESSGGVPGDWIELVNAGTTTLDISGYVLQDNGSDRFVIPSGTSIAPGAFLAFDVEPSFGLGGSDSARLFAPDGTTLLDSTSWTAHASPSWGRCPDASGAFGATSAITKGAANACAGLLTPEAWPGGSTVTIVDDAATFGTDLSGLVYEPSATAGTRGTLWGVVNGTGVLHRLTWTGSTWAPAAGSWSDGLALRYPNGSGVPDSEGLTFGGTGPGAGIFVATERDGSAGSVSRPSVLRYDLPSDPGAALSATQEWNLAGVIPPVGNNSGLEGITWVPDSFLVAQGFTTSAGAPYVPTSYPTHGSGLFFVGVEGTGDIYAVALGTDGSATLVATIDPTLAIVADVTFDVSTGELWAVCDEACQGRTVVLEIAQSGESDGDFVPTHLYENPAGMPDTLANEGFAIGSADLCANGVRPVWYADDADTGGFALREGTLTSVCSGTGGPGTGGPGTGEPGTGEPGTPTTPTEDVLTPETEGGVSGPGTATAGGTLTIDVGAAYAGEEVDVWIFSTPTHLGTFVVPASGRITVRLPASLPAGAHRLAVLDASGAVIGWYPLTVRAAGLAATGGAVSWALLPLAAGALLVGAGAVATTGIRRRRAA